MKMRSLVAAALAAVSGIAAAGNMADARATSSTEIDELRSEIATLRSDYEARIERLEARLAAAENVASTTTPSPSAAYQAAPLPVENLESAAATGTTAPGNGFN